MQQVLTVREDFMGALEQGKVNCFVLCCGWTDVGCTGAFAAAPVWGGWPPGGGAWMPTTLLVAGSLRLRRKRCSNILACRVRPPGLPQKAAERDMPRLPCGCASLAECKCLQGASTAAQAAAPLALAHRGLEVSGGPSCPLTGLTLSQIAELKGSPPEALQQDWKRIAQRLRWAVGRGCEGDCCAQRAGRTRRAACGPALRPACCVWRDSWAAAAHS